MRERPILIAGAGIAGLTAALAFARHGFSVEIYDRARSFERTGAGIQLSPNATRLLFDLGLREVLLAASARPEAVVLRGAGNLNEHGRVRLGEWGEQRWGAPYLTLHRAELHRVLLDAVRASRQVSLSTGCAVKSVDNGATALIDAAAGDGGGERTVSGAFVVAADGVHSAIRNTPSRPTGLIAWRSRLAAPDASSAGRIFAPNDVTALLHRHAHLVCYPMHDGAFNLVAIAPASGEIGDEDDHARLVRAFAGTAPALRDLVRRQDWTAWPILVTGGNRKPAPFWRDQMAGIGDAAHALMPFAAQGAAMAIEDAVTLADAIAASRSGHVPQLDGWMYERAVRLARVERRGRMNGLAWHASGPLALARNLFLKTRSPEALAADLDWLYAWKPATPAAS